jgi:hypothetical protein
MVNDMVEISKSKDKIVQVRLLRVDERRLTTQATMSDDK